MEIQTRDFGIVNIDEEDIIVFTKGLLGFVEYKEFVLLPLDEDSPFIIMQSVGESDLAFILTNPWDIITDYEFEISSKIEDALEIEEEKDLLIFVITSIHQHINDMTVNLAAPLVINHTKKLGKQLIIDNYPVRQAVFTDDKDKEQVAK